MLKKFLLMIMVILFSTILFGCGAKKVVVEGPVRNESCIKSDSINVDVYIDGTFSMAGYVNYPTTTVYVNALKEVERTIASTWKKDNVQFIKFGDEYHKLNREQFLEFNKISFYEQLDTSLQKVIENIDETKMNIIATDLFQTNQDIESLMLAIKRKCFANDDNSLAIIGLKSQFNGRIYDIGKNLVAYDYASNTEIDSYRPFYFLVIGKDIDVRSFVEAYSKKFSGEPYFKVAMYAKHIGTNRMLVQDTTNSIKPEKGDKARPMAKINSLVNDDSVLQYRLNMDTKELSKANVLLISNSVVGDCPDNYVVKVESIEKWSSDNSHDSEQGLFDKIKGKKETANGSYKFKELNAKDFINGKVLDVGLRKGTINMFLDLRLNPIGIKKREGIYRTRLSVVPSKEEYLKVMDIFSEWNFDDSKLVEDGGIKEVGCKTLNISKFTDMMSTLNYEMNEPGFYDLYVYFDAKN